MCSTNPYIFVLSIKRWIYALKKIQQNVAEYFVQVHFNYLGIYLFVQCTQTTCISIKNV